MTGQSATYEALKIICMFFGPLYPPAYKPDKRRGGGSGKRARRSTPRGGPAGQDPTPKGGGALQTPKWLYGTMGFVGAGDFFFRRTAGGNFLFYPMCLYSKYCLRGKPPHHDCPAVSDSCPLLVCLVIRITGSETCKIKPPSKRNSLRIRTSVLALKKPECSVVGILLSPKTTVQWAFPRWIAHEDWCCSDEGNPSCRCTAMPRDALGRSA